MRGSPSSAAPAWSPTGYSPAGMNNRKWELGCERPSSPSTTHRISEPGRVRRTSWAVRWNRTMIPSFGSAASRGEGSARSGRAAHDGGSWARTTLGIAQRAFCAGMPSSCSRSCPRRFRCDRCARDHSDRRSRDRCPDLHMVGCDLRFTTRLLPRRGVDGVVAASRARGPCGRASSLRQIGALHLLLNVGSRERDKGIRPRSVQSRGRSFRRESRRGGASGQR